MLAACLFDEQAQSFEFGVSLTYTIETSDRHVSEHDQLVMLTGEYGDNYEYELCSCVSTIATIRNDIFFFFFLKPFQ